MASSTDNLAVVEGVPCAPERDCIGWRSGAGGNEVDVLPDCVLDCICVYRHGNARDRDGDLVLAIVAGDGGLANDRHSG